jgi:protein-L-isoaspartate(D-aspartate) O-methyltransferase
MSSEVLRAALQTAQRARARMIERLREQGIRDERVLAAMMAVPRQLFVEEALASRAYEDTALPLGLQQTISQPFVVARMIEILGAGRELGKTLEVGTGCGYQAAVCPTWRPRSIRSSACGRCSTVRGSTCATCACPTCA